MNVLKNVVVSLITLLAVDMYVQPAYSLTVREVIIVSEKKYISPAHVQGLDTYGNPVDYYRREQYILRFKDRNGFFNVNKELFNNTWIGREFTTEDNELYFCRSTIDECDSSK